MSELGELYKGLKEAKSEKKKDNKENSTKLLTEHDVEFESRNNGVHLIVYAEGDKLIDFWPSTGLWIRRWHTQKRERGVMRLLKELGKCES